jgi:hypothetical protein
MHQNRFVVKYFLQAQWSRLVRYFLWVITGACNGFVDRCIMYYSFIYALEDNIRQK